MRTLHKYIAWNSSLWTQARWFYEVYSFCLEYSNTYTRLLLFYSFVQINIAAVYTKVPPCQKNFFFFVKFCFIRKNVALNAYMTWWLVQQLYLYILWKAESRSADTPSSCPCFFSWHLQPRSMQHSWVHQLWWLKWEPWGLEQSNRQSLSMLFTFLFQETLSLKNGWTSR